MISPNYFHSSQRLGFRWWTKDDLELARKLWGDPEVTRTFYKEPLGEAQIEERLQTEIERATTYGIQYWPIFELSTHDHVGCCGLRPYKPEEKIAELGFHLRPAHWGKGFATEAAVAVLDYAKNRLGFDSIFAGHHPENNASRAVLLKLGFKGTGTVLYPPTGLLHPAYLLQLGKSD